MQFCDKPLAFLDLESTGLDIATDRIIQVGIVKVDYTRPQENKHHPSIAMDQLVNPCRPIPNAITQLTGIQNEHVMHAPTFGDVADKILDLIAGCDLVGYNLRQFDLPLLAEEMNRVGRELVITGRVIDCGVVMKRKEGRTLADAVRMYCGGREIASHHSAFADAMSTLSVMWGQIEKYKFNTIDELASWGKHEDDNRIDFAGKLARDADGDAIYTFGQRTKGVKVRDDPGFAHWVLNRDFTSDTKRHLRQILADLEAERADQTWLEDDVAAIP